MAGLTVHTFKYKATCQNYSKEGKYCKNITTCSTIYVISYIGFLQVIWADMTRLGFIFPELKAREIYNLDRSYQPV